MFPVGDMQGYLNLKGYGEFEAANRPSGWNTWLTFRDLADGTHQYRGANAPDGD